MKFWDASALVALLVAEPDSAGREALVRADPAIAIWWTTPVECDSAVQRRLREGSLDPTGARQARERLRELGAAWHEVPPTPALRSLAVRLLRTHPLRAADALQLAAALTLTAALGRKIDFVCADERLAEAAEVEGLPVLN